MEALKEKECYVCGKTTEQRCSACKKLFFCSSAHQKLLWSTHKHLCGKEGFVQPPLKQQEVDWVLSPLCGLSVLEFKSIVNQARAVDSALQHVSALDILNAKQSTIAHVRNVCKLTSCFYYDTAPTKLHLKPFAEVAGIEISLKLVLPAGADTRAFQPILEQALYLNTLINLYSTSATNTDTPNDLVNSEMLNRGVARIRRSVDGLQGEVGAEIYRQLDFHAGLLGMLVKCLFSVRDLAQRRSEEDRGAG